MSRNEEIMQAIINGQPMPGNPKSRNEALLQGIGEVINGVKSDLTLQNPLCGKTIKVFGDSMVAGATLDFSKTWISKIAQRNNMTVINKAVNGTTIVYADTTTPTGSATYPANTSIYTKVFADSGENNEPADYIVLFGGTNDIARSVTLGSDASTSPSEFYCAYKRIIKSLITENPTSKLLVITPYARQSGDVTYAICKQFVDAIVEICSLYSVPVFNNVLEGGICWSNETYLQTNALTMRDTYHLNETGHEWVSYKYETKLKYL